MVYVSVLESTGEIVTKPPQINSCRAGFLLGRKKVLTVNSFQQRKTLTLVLPSRSVYDLTTGLLVITNLDSLGLYWISFYYVYGNLLV